MYMHLHMHMLQELVYEMEINRQCAGIHDEPMKYIGIIIIIKYYHYYIIQH